MMTDMVKSLKTETNRQNTNDRKESTTMKKSIKAIAAALSAVVMCALPAASSLNADAAARTLTYKQTYVTTTTNLGYSGVRLYVRKGPQIRYGCLSLGNINNTRLGGGSWSDSTTTESVGYNDIYATNSNGINEIGILADWQFSTTFTGNGFAGMHADGDKNGVMAFESCLGDISGSINNVYDGVTLADARKIRKMADNKFRSGVTTNNITSYMLSGYFYSLDFDLFAGMLAADINGDRRITYTDADAVECYVNNKAGARDLSTFNGMDENTFRTRINQIMNS